MSQYCALFVLVCLSLLRITMAINLLAMQRIYQTQTTTEPYLRIYQSDFKSYSRGVFSLRLTGGAESHSSERDVALKFTTGLRSSNSDLNLEGFRYRSPYDRSEESELNSATNIRTKATTTSYHPPKLSRCVERN